MNDLRKTNGGKPTVFVSVVGNKKGIPRRHLAFKYKKGLILKQSLIFQYLRASTAAGSLVSMILMSMIKPSIAHQGVCFISDIS